MPHLLGFNITGLLRDFLPLFVDLKIDPCSGNDQQKKDSTPGGADSSTAPQLPILGQWLSKAAISTNIHIYSTQVLLCILHLFLTKNSVKHIALHPGRDESVQRIQYGT